jgi:hypothetical protein
MPSACVWCLPTTQAAKLLGGGLDAALLKDDHFALKGPEGEEEEEVADLTDFEDPSLQEHDAVGGSCVVRGCVRELANCGAPWGLGGIRVPRCHRWWWWWWWSRGGREGGACAIY